MLHDRRDEARLAFAAERFSSGQHLIDKRTERPNVGAGIDGLAFQLLRSHVLEGSDDGLLLGEVLLPSRRVGSFGSTSVVREEFREPEVQKLYPGLRQHDVGRFQVSVRDPCAVSRIQTVYNLDSVLESFIERQRAFLEPVRQRLALDVLHHEVLDAVLASDIMKDADVRMIQLRDRFRFALEALFPLRNFSEVFRQNFDGDGAVEASVFGFVNLAHPADADGRNDLVTS